MAIILQDVRRILDFWTMALEPLSDIVSQDILLAGYPLKITFLMYSHLGLE